MKEMYFFLYSFYTSKIYVSMCLMKFYDPEQIIEFHTSAINPEASGVKSKILNIFYHFLL
ncbi:hypothetical protein OA88_18370 [Flavobacterium sp. JRM]|nr:hypothetical protein OA88_18370 [Flavobacterium sp. JRM]